MIYDEIMNFLGQQNFALARTTLADVTILKNKAADCDIFCVIIENTGGHAYGPSQIADLNARLKYFNGIYNDVLFLVITDDLQRDKILSQISDTRLWIVDEPERRLFIYEGQPEDFYGLRFGIEETIAGERYPQKGIPQKRNFKANAKCKIESLPYVTIILIAVNVLYFILVAANGSLSNSSYMLKMGANYGVYVFQKWQVWRILTGMFMHFSFSHLLGNMFYLGVSGYNLEKTAGHLKFFLIYMLSGIGAGLVSAGYYYLTDPATITAGASGAVYGLLGAMLYVTFRNRGKLRSPQMFLRIGIILIYLYYSNFTQTGIDGAAHIAGFVFGLILCIILLGGKKNERR